MIFSENRLPTPDQVRGRLFRDHALTFHARNFGRDRRDQFRLPLSALLTPHLHVRIPRARRRDRGTSTRCGRGRAAPSPRSAGRARRRDARSCCSPSRRRRRRHQRREPIDVVGVVDVGEPLDRDAELALDAPRSARGVAVLQIDEAAVGQPQQRLEIGSRALLCAADRRLADPGEPDDEAAVLRQPRAQRVRALGRPRDSRARGAGTSPRARRRSDRGCRSALRVDRPA